MENRVNIKVVSLKEPCTACIIIDNLIKETLKKLQKEFPYVEVEIIELDNIKRVYEIPGMEVEKLPAIFIDGIQVTAGSLPTKQQLIAMITGGMGQ